MTTTPSPRSLRVDAALLRNMTRDATIYSLTRPTTLILLIAFAAAVVLDVIVLTLILANEPERAANLFLLLALMLIVVIAMILLTRRSVRRALTAAMPEGSVVLIAVGDESLYVEAAQGLSDIAYSAFRGLRVGRDAVLLQLRGVAAVTALPRPLLTDADIEFLRAKVTAAAVAA